MISFKICTKCTNNKEISCYAHFSEASFFRSIEMMIIMIFCLNMNNRFYFNWMLCFDNNRFLIWFISVWRLTAYIEWPIFSWSKIIINMPRHQYMVYVFVFIMGMEIYSNNSITFSMALHSDYYYYYLLFHLKI